MFKYIKIGRIKKSIRSNGEVVATIQSDFVEDTINSKAIFLEIDGLNVPFFTEHIECEGNICYIKFEDIDSPEEAKAYNNTDISLRECDINWTTKTRGTISAQSDFSGFEIYDTVSDTILLIENTEQFPQQLMAKAISNTDNKEYFIPLVNAFIEDIDYINKRITLSLPEGLI